MIRMNRSRKYVGIAVGADALHVVALDGSRRPCANGDNLVVPLEGPRSEALELAFLTVAERVGRPFTAWLCLLPPLARIRWIELPPVSDRDARRLIAREAGRYFIDAGAAQCVGVRRRRRRRTVDPRVLAVAADAELVDALERAVASAGGALGGIVAAHAAWSAVRHHEPNPPADPSVTIVAADCLYVLHSRGGQLVGQRRFALDCLDADSLRAAVGPGPATPTVLAEEPARSAIAAMLQQTGPDDTVHRVGPRRETPALAAAAAAAVAAGPELISERLIERARTRGRLRASVFAAAAACIVLAAGGLELWGVRRELHELGVRRAEIRQEVEQVSAARELLDEVNLRLSALAGLGQSAPDWTRVIADIAEHLPREAHLVSVRASGDTVRIEGVAADASAALGELRRVPSLANLAADAPIRRELREGEPTLERFFVVARLRPTTEAVR
jgi:Tfp pilus assembly protein PilN